MRVGIDAHMIGERETGNERYTANLIRGLGALPADGHEYRLLSPRPEALRQLVDSPFEIVRVRPSSSALRIPVGMPLAIRGAGIDVLHVSYIAPPIPLSRTVVTVHDLSYLAHPEWLSRRVRLLLSTLVPPSLRRAARVIAISEFTKRDLIARYALPPEKIVVVPEAPDAVFAPITNASTMALPSGVREPFVLAVGNLEPRKNLGRLIEAFGRLLQTGFSGSLVIAGQPKYASNDAGGAVSRLGLETQVVFTGFVSDEILRLLYNRAALFVYPSLYEGFGLPPLEAMACGCPVVASNATAIPETLADAAILVDPMSIESIGDGMRRVLNDPALAQRLRARGLQHASRFSWTQAAELTRRVYDAAVADRHPVAA